MILGFEPFGVLAFSALPNPRVIARMSFGLSAFLVTGYASTSISFSAAANWDFRVQAASEEFGPLPGTLRKALTFERSIVGSGRFGDFTRGTGELELVNSEGDYDHLIRGYAIDGRRVVLRVGTRDLDLADFAVIYDGTAAGWHIDEDTLRVRLQDHGFKLDIPAQQNSYGGTGGADGSADLKGKRKPRAFGSVNYVEPPLVIANAKAFQVNDGPVDDITAVFVRGVSLARGADYPTVDAMVAATITPGYYVTCLAAGWFRVNFVLEGVVTAHLRGDKAGGVFASSAAEIVRRVITMAGVKDPAEIDTASFARVQALQPAPIGVWFGADDGTTVVEAAARIMSSVGGWAGYRRNGQFEVGVFTAPSGIPTERYNRTDIALIERRELPAGINPPPWRWRIPFARNWTVQTDIAGAVFDDEPDRAALMGEPYKVAEASSVLIKANHPLAKDPEPLDSFFRDEGDAQAEADRQLALYGRVNSLYRIVLNTPPFLLDIGDVVEVTFPRWDLVAGRLLRVVLINEECGQDGAESDLVEIMGFG